jgi:uncharacterized protein (TIGR00369 family)
MATNPNRVAFKRALANLGSANPEPMVMKQSPFAESLAAAILSVDLEQKLLRARFTPGAQYLQGAGALQGGILATMLDFSMAFITLAVLPEELSCATAQLNIHYLKVAQPGTYIVESRVEKAGKRLVFTNASIAPEGGDEPVASATAVFTVLGS